MIIGSIDPGKSGAIVISDYSGGLLNVKVTSYVMPLLKNKKEYDIRTLKEIIFNSHCDFLIIEDVHSVYGASAKANFIFGMGVGIVRGMVEASNLPYQLVPPKTWQKEAWEGITKVKDAKKNSQTAVHRLFPHVNLKASKRCTVDHDGIMDAILIGYYAYLKFNKQK